jgi:salicylate hydroxylase
MLRIGIIGGGIGGTSAALQLGRTGFEVDVFEKTRDLTEVGAGINISPNAATLLHRLGLKSQLSAMGVIPRAWHQRRWKSGETLQWSDLATPVEDAFGAPQYQMHRADVLGLLSSRISPDRLHRGTELVALEQSDEAATAVFRDGERRTFDLLVGADGIHSRTREMLFGPAQPVFKNCIAYRGLIPSERIAHLSIPVEAQIWLGPGRHFVHYYVRNGTLLNFVANVDRGDWSEESWSKPGDIHVLRREFGDWHFHIRSITEAVTETFILALHDRQPLEKWSRGRVTLLGDACHPMEPHVAQGAAQAIEDGATLSACLAASPSDVPGALRRYEALRLPRTARIQQLADVNRHTFHLPDGPAQRDRDAALARDEIGFAISRIGWIYGHDAGEIGPEKTENPV